MNRIGYGNAGYGPLGDTTDTNAAEDVGDFVDFIDPLGIRKIPGKIEKKIDNYVEAKSQRAANLASQRVEQGVKKAMGDSAKTALMVAAGGVLVGGTVAAVMTYRSKKAREEGGRGR